MAKMMTITKSDWSALVRLLGLLQDSLECDIVSNVVPETNEAPWHRGPLSHNETEGG